ncbi:MAG: ribose 5-phosphate isomerase [Desulfobulbaceae bacterium BRH_c16a]|nr:MAG: ribose 5-phosphate isomerase [Desulfobulbaceae bacterium BRH_c16a]
MKIVVAADHGGYDLKEAIQKDLVHAGHQVVDVGCFSKDSVDYPDFVEKAVERIVTGECPMGILVCGTGIGMAIAANRHRSIRAANCTNVYTAKMSREHNNANVLCLGARVLETADTLEMVKVWLTTDFAGGRHTTRIAKFSD